jgi:hypothetical protein
VSKCDAPWRTGFLWFWGEFWGEFDTCGASIILNMYSINSRIRLKSPKILVSRSAVAQNNELVAEAIDVYLQQNYNPLSRCGPQRIVRPWAVISARPMLFWSRVMGGTYARALRGLSIAPTCLLHTRYAAPAHTRSIYLPFAESLGPAPLSFHV